MNIYVARQPIFDINYDVIGYELLYRDSEINSFNVNISDRIATSIVLTNTYFNFGIEKLIGEKKAFINFDKKLVNLGIPELLDKDKVVIEILESVKPDKVFIQNLKKMSEKGYIFAMDDYTANYNYDDILDFCTIIKIDFRCNSMEEIEKMAFSFKEENKMILAEKIETADELEFAKKLKFDFYQGYFFSKPKIESKMQKLSTSPQYLMLMSQLNELDADFDVISNIILSDVSLTYKILKLVNADPRIKIEISSIRQALSMLGLKTFSKWMSLAILLDNNTSQKKEIIKNAIVRSYLMKEIAICLKLNDYIEELELIGVLSVMDIVLEVDMEEVLESISVSKIIKDTLLGKETNYSTIYNIPIHYEKGEFNQVDKLVCEINCDIESVKKNYIDGLSYAEIILS